MVDRCCNPNVERYCNYGGRGITVCKDWLSEDGFINFYNWSMSNGYEKNLTLDRMNVNGDYEPNNCKWSTYKEQANNRRNTLYVEIDGIIKTATEWEKEYDLPQSTLKNRVSRGWDKKDLLQKVINVKSEKQSGVKGITWNKRRGKWIIRVKQNKKLVQVGGDTNLEKAKLILDEFKNAGELHD